MNHNHFLNYLNHKLPLTIIAAIKEFKDAPTEENEMKLKEEKVRIIDTVQYGPGAY